MRILKKLYGATSLVAEDGAAIGNKAAAESNLRTKEKLSFSMTE
jgi:hypothetical protein